MTDNKHPRIEIKTDEEYVHITHIYIDGYEIKGVRSYHLSQEIGEIPHLLIDINALNLTTDQPQVLLGIKGVDNVQALVMEGGNTVNL